MSKSKNAFKPIFDDEQVFYFETEIKSKGRNKSSGLSELTPKSKKVNSELDNSSAWEKAHELFDENKDNTSDLTYVEPETTSNIFDKNTLEVKSFGDKKADYLVNWPRPKSTPDEFVWNLGDSYSQLAMAREKVWASLGKKKIRVAHIDTGYQIGHPVQPEKLLWKFGRSYVKGEENNPGIDHSLGTFQEQDGHGMATLAFLAGGKVTKEQTKGMYEGYFGGIPFAEVIPIRINDTVALIKSKAFVRAIEYAILKGCEVVTMSMAGLPSKAWAKIINIAYESGITIVTAAGNSWIKGGQKHLPKSVLYPARFDRVIAACGVTSNHQPYVFDVNSWPRPKSEGGEWMQGNFGPKARMNTAIAAYTPNVAWATTNGAEPFTMTGGGTSSATPQVAAAAALWLVHHQEWLNENGYRGTWRQVEAVRHALFQSAKKVKKYEKYYGNGIMKANDALDILPKKSDLKMSGKANVVFTGFTELFKLFFKTKSGLQEVSQPLPENMNMYMVELVQVIHQEPALQHFCEVDFDDFEAVLKVFNKKNMKLLKSVIDKSSIASSHLKKFVAELP